MKQQCEVVGDFFEVSEPELEFLRRNNIPLRSSSPHEMLRHILSFRSSPQLFHATCAISGARIVTVLPPDSGYRVYEAALENELAAEQYGRPYDFQRSFFDQFEELVRTVPYFSRAGVPTSNENSDYSQGVMWSKNCYLCFRLVRCEDCLYSRYIRNSKDLVDCVWCIESELAYACSDLTRCYDLAFSEHCVDCSSGRFLSDCIGCRDCICCVGLRSAQYCFKNQQLTAEEYRDVQQQLRLDSRAQCEEWMKQLAELNGAGGRQLFIDRCEDSTGNHLVGCARAKDSYFLFDCVDVESCVGVQKLTSSFFAVGHGSNSELLYACEVVGDQAYDVRYSMSCQNSVQSLEYCINCSSGTAHCFGSVGLRRASYSILNRRYNKTEYEDLTARIRQQMRDQGEYGQFLPRRFSPFAFNRSEACEFLPLAEAEAIRRGFRWKQEEAADGGTASAMPDLLSDVGTSHTTLAYRCEASERSYQVQASELAFHLRVGIALPKFAPLERLTQRGRFLRMG